jgi:cation/acetate symporter
MRPRPVRTAAAISTVVVSIFYLLAQMVGAGTLVALLLGVDSGMVKDLTIAGVGLLMIFYVTLGGMKGTSWVQIVKAMLLMGGTVMITFLVLVRFHFNFSDLLGAAAHNSGKGQDFLQPGLLYGTDLVTKLDFVSLALALVLGTAGLPHILIRFNTVPTSRDARKTVLWAIGLIGAFYLMTLALGFGAAALLKTGKGSDVFNSEGNLASPLLAQAVGGGERSAGGAVLLALISAVAFATILAVVAGLTLTSASSVAHDIYANLITRGRASEEEELRVARIAAFVIGAIAIVLSIFAQSLNIAFLVALAFAVAASGNVPALVYNLFWRRFNTRGAVWSIYGGLGVALLLVVFSPVVSGSPTALFPHSDWSLFPLENPGIVSIPAGFLLGWLGTVTSSPYPDADARYDELEARALTGAGAATVMHDGYPHTRPHDWPELDEFHPGSFAGVPTTFVHLPVKDLARTTDFFAGLGFTFNEELGDEQTACLMVSDQACVMFDAEPTFAQLTEQRVTDTSTSREVLIGLSADSRAEVDEVVANAVRHGGGAVGAAEDHGSRYMRTFLDPDGHQWASVYMDTATVPPSTDGYRPRHRN